MFEHLKPKSHPTHKGEEFLSLYRKVRQGSTWNACNSPTAHDLARFRTLEAKMDASFQALSKAERLEACRKLVEQGFISQGLLGAMESFSGANIENVSTVPLKHELEYNKRS